jgi:hypothetical protein
VSWVSQQCCVWHLWRGLARELGQRVSEAAQGLVGEAAQEQVRRELVALMHGVLDAATRAQAETTLAQLEAHRLGVGLAQALWDQLDAALVWAIYRNFNPAQWRSERKRHYRYPGRSHLAVAGASPGDISYLDALGV